MRLKKKVFSDKIEFEYFINVTKEGLFTAYLPEDVMLRMENCGIKVAYGRGRKKGYFEASTLKAIEESIWSMTEKFNKKNLVESKIVLRYDIITNCSYCKTKKDEIVPNGGWEQRLNGKEGYNRLEGTQEQNANYARPFGFKVFVEIRRLNIYSFPDKSQHKEYVSLNENEVKEGSTLDWLNSICGINWEDESDVKDIDYTEEIGLFFKNAIFYICNLNEKLKAMFGEKIEISQSKVKLLPSPLEKKDA